MSIFVKRQGAPFTKREITARPGLGRYLPISLGIGLVLGYLGPYGSYATPLAERMFFWGLMALAGHILTEGSFRLIMRACPHWAWLPVAVGVAIAASLPIALLVWLLMAQLWNKTHPQMLEVYFQVLLIEATIALPLIWWCSRSALISATAPLSQPTQDRCDESPFLRRIPAALGRDLLSLTMEDHYLRIHTPLGSDLILMRLRDAVAELEGMGLQVHRSHWVAEGAVMGHEKRDGRIWLLLRDARAIPVSKAGQPAVRAAGWLKRHP